MDGFQLASGVAALIAAPILLVRGTAPAECLLLFGSGVVIVAAQSVIATHTTLRQLDGAHAALAAVGLVCLLLAITYLTRSAEDLPRLLPGHNANSQSLRLVPGIVSLFVATVALSRAAAMLRPLPDATAVARR